MKPLYSVTLTSGSYPRHDQPAAINGMYADVREAIAAVSQAAAARFGPVGSEWSGGTIISDTGVTLTLDHEGRHPVWIVSRQVEAEWSYPVEAIDKETVVVNGAEYSRDVKTKRTEVTATLKMFAARIRLSSYLVEGLHEAAETDDTMDERAEAIADAAWDAMKKETP